MNEIVFIVEKDPEGGFIARAVGESIFTQADTMAELREQARDAVRCHCGLPRKVSKMKIVLTQRHKEHQGIR